MTEGLRTKLDAPKTSKPTCPFCGRRKRADAKTCALCADLPALCPTFPVAN